MQVWTQPFANAGPWTPWLYLALFVGASFLMIWRLESMCKNGLEGTVLGTLVMPYCSGLGNLIFVFVLSQQRGSGAEVITNSLVNNITNLTFLLGVPAVFWGLRVTRKTSESGERGKKAKGAVQEQQLNRLSLLLTLVAALFFCGVTWALGRDRRFDFNDGLVLVGLFLFWQCFHVFEVLKTNVRQSRTLGWMLFLDAALLAVGAWGIYLSVNWLVQWILRIDAGFVSVKHLGWLSGWLMVLPNGILAVYYAWRRRPDIVYSSQVGDGHICIPLCIGLSALLAPIKVPELFGVGIQMIGGACIVHFLLVSLLGGIPRWLGWGFIAAYAIFLYEGLV